MMNLHCIFCGQSLPSNSMLCSRCRSSSLFQAIPVNNSDTSVLSGSIPWAVETCEIGWMRRVQGLTARITFHAETTTFRDKRIIANSEPLPDIRAKIGIGVYIPRETAEAIAAVRQIVDTLLQDGWQPAIAPMGFWWKYHFMRPIRP
jgi:hypothetical protein